MPSIKGFFFDLDGTLVDTHQANFEAYARALADSGVIITFDDFKPMIGHQAKKFLPILAPGLTEEEYKEIAERKAEYYKELAHLTRLNVNLVKFIEGMKTDHTIALVTTARRRNAAVVLAHHGLDKVFDCIVTADDVEQSKPRPDGYLKSLQITGLNADEVIAFEDSQVGSDAAQGAGISVVMVGEFKL
jgi:beta-phosphoglucomutase